MSEQRIMVLENKFHVHPVFTNHAASKDGLIVNLKRKRPFRGISNNYGYLYFDVYLSKGKIKHYRSHRFICEAIKGPIPEGYEINHINKCKTDNRIENLELLTHTENFQFSCNKKVIAINIETRKQQISSA